MKYLAILKDSVREAIDSKVFYVMLGLSLLVILFVAGIGFNPESPEKALQTIVDRFPGATQLNPRIPPIHYAVEDFEQVNAGAKPWEGEYRFTLAVEEPEGWGPLFRLMVHIQHDPQAMGRFQALAKDAEDKPPAERDKYFQEQLARELSKVTNEQMEEFVADHLSGGGNLETTLVKVKKTKAMRIDFDVLAKAKPNTFRVWPHSITFFSVDTRLPPLPIAVVLLTVEDILVGSIGAAITLLLSVVITAFFIPNMLRKGTVDLLLVKPISRSVLLIYKYIGGMAFMFLNTVFIVVGLWVVLGVRSGIWAPSFLLIIFILTFQFAMFYAVSTFFGVLTRSPIVAILISCFVWGMLFVAGWAYRYIDATREFKVFSESTYATADIIHYVLPRYKDMDVLTQHLLMEDLFQPDDAQRKALDKQFKSFHWGEALIVTSLYIVLALGASCAWFSWKDY